MALGTILVYADLAADKPLTITLELLTKARAMASAVEVFYPGDASPFAGTFGEFGATKVHQTGPLGDVLIGPRAAGALGALVGSAAPDAIFFGQTYEGRDVAARLAVKIDRPVLTNSFDVSESNGSLAVQTAIFGGNTLVTTSLTGAAPQLAMFRPKSFAAEPSGGGAAAVADVSVPDTGRTGAAKVLARHVEEATGPKLDEAEIVVSGGRGLGEAAKYEMIEQLAKLLRGAPGASRAIVDAGWVPYSYQVGQTGKVVKPTVYLACGISGATQHMVGMKGAKNIIAVNKDKEAPIFSIADLGVVGDVHKVLPKLIDALKSR